MVPKLIIHGGAGSAIKDESRKDAVRDALMRVAEAGYEFLASGVSARQAVVHTAEMLEDSPHFNAGLGSAIQSDGQIRMSASLMDGAEQSFSGVINIQKIQHPIGVANHLQSMRDRVLAWPGTEELARELELPVFNPMVERRLREWRVEYGEEFQKEAANVGAEDDDRGKGTIGVVAIDEQGRIAAGTSTGGRGFEYVGRVSDSATVAGNYATEHAGISCTGIGEHIVDAALGARVVTRVTDGMSLREALKRSMDECEEREHVLGAIAIDADGNIAWGKTSDILLAAWHDGERLDHTVDIPHEPLVDGVGAGDVGE